MKDTLIRFVVGAAACCVRRSRRYWQSCSGVNVLSAAPCFALLLLAVSVSPRALAQANGGSTVATRYIEALQKVDFKTVIDLSYGYQSEVNQIKAQNPQVLWPKLTKEYYDAKIASLTNKPGFWESYMQGMMGDSSQQIRFMQSLLLPNVKWKVTETRSDHVQDSIQFGGYDRTVVYITVTYPALNDSPFVDGKFLKETILEFDLNTKSQLVMTLGRVAKGDTPWEARLMIMNTSWQLGQIPFSNRAEGHLRSEAIGGKAPYTWTPRCGSVDLSQSLTKRDGLGQPIDQRNVPYLMVDLGGFTNNMFPLHCAVTVTDGTGQTDTIGMTVPRMLTGLSDFCWVKAPWFSRGQGRPGRPVTCIEPIIAMDTATESAAAATPAVPNVSAETSPPQGASPAAPSASPCSEFDGCMLSARKAYGAKDWSAATVAFQAASAKNPASGEPWVWLGRILLARNSGPYNLQELSRAWDKALSLGAQMLIPACHERTLQPCERGDLSLGTKSVTLVVSGPRTVFSVTPNEIAPGRIFNNTAGAHISYNLQVTGKKVALDFFPYYGSLTCEFNLMVQCPSDVIAGQLVLAQFVAQTLPKLASGALAANVAPVIPPTVPSATAPTPVTVAAPIAAARTSEVTVSVKEWDLPQSFYVPSSITSGPDSALWFTGGNRIGRVTTAGVIAGYDIPTPKSGPGGITTGPDGALWFAELTASKIGRITTAGIIKEYPVPSGAHPWRIASGPDGALWFTESEGRIGRITTGGTVTEYPVQAPSRPSEIAAGKDGALWFADNLGNSIGRITTAGLIKQYPVPSSDGYPSGITSGPDGALWFSEPQSHKIGRITTDGTITEFPVTMANSGPGGIATGPDGSLWFTDNPANKIGRITTAGNITEYALPTDFSNPGLGIVNGSDGALWFIESGKIGRIMPSQSPSLSTSTCSQAVDVGYVILLEGHLYKTKSLGPAAGPDRRLFFIDEKGAQVTDSILLPQLTAAVWTRENVIASPDARNGRMRVEGILGTSIQIQGYTIIQSALVSAMVEAIEAGATGGASLGKALPSLTLGLLKSQASPKTLMTLAAQRGLETSRDRYQAMQTPPLPPQDAIAFIAADLARIRELYFHARSLELSYAALAAKLMPKTTGDLTEQALLTAFKQVLGALAFAGSPTEVLTAQRLLDLQKGLANLVPALPALKSYSEDFNLATKLTAADRDTISKWAVGAGQKCTF